MISHGYKVDTENDPLVTIADEAVSIHAYLTAQL